MITNERQYAITRAQAERFKESLAKADEPGEKLHPKVRKAIRDGLRSQLQDLETEIAEFERLRDGKVTTIVVNSIVEVAVALIQARIARNWTQKQLGEKLNLPEQQIQRYESTRYKGVALERLQKRSTIPRPHGTAHRRAAKGRGRGTHPRYLPERISCLAGSEIALHDI